MTKREGMTKSECRKKVRLSFRLPRRSAAEAGQSIIRASFVIRHSCFRHCQFRLVLVLDLADYRGRRERLETTFTMSQCQHTEKRTEHVAPAITASRAATHVNPVLPHFLILTSGRTGSSHLVSLLDSHPDLCCFGELFRPAEASLPFFYVNTPHTDPHEYLASLTDRVGKRLMGFKLTPNCLATHPEAERLLQDTRVRVILLRRVNLLAQALSGGLAKATGVWHSTGGKRNPHAQVRIPPERIVGTLIKLQEQQLALVALCREHPVFELSYEDLAADNRLDDVQRFLGVEPQPLTSRYRRLDPRPLREKIENWEEVRAALVGTQFEGLL
jgi:LPS sulfotransferase NodH